MMNLINVYEDREDQAVEFFLFRVLRDRLSEPIANISHTAMPTWEEHKEFIKKKVYHAWYAIQNTSEDLIGTVFITKTNELGIFIRKPFRGKGYASWALNTVMKMHPPLPGQPSQVNPRFVANIRDGNAASIALFESLGAKILSHTYLL